MHKKIMLLGSGELGKEFAIAAQRLGQFIIAVDSYENAPAMQVANAFEVISMLDGTSLEKIVSKHKPDIIVPEIEAIRTEKLYEFEQRGIQVVPSAKAADFTMNRKSIRDLVANELVINTATYRYANSQEALLTSAIEVGFPCVVKPLMSSSGKGQSVMRSQKEVATSWEYAQMGSRGDLSEVIVESFIDFEYEITLLTVSQHNGKTLFCPPIGHVQSGGDYQQSWQPMLMDGALLKKAQQMAEKVVKALGGFGIWGVEFFIGKDQVWFSELSPRPHDTGMVTLAGTQNINEFELHLRAILQLPIPEITLLRKGVSSVILSSLDKGTPNFSGLFDALNQKNVDIRIFGKPFLRKNRRMGISLSWGNLEDDMEQLKTRAVEVAGKVVVSKLD